MNCFLNSAIQAIYHMINLELSSLLFSCENQRENHSCVTCSLLKVLELYNNEILSSKSLLYPIELRQQMATLMNSNTFEINQKADSMEALNALLVNIHNSFSGIFNSKYLEPIESCSCPVHKSLTLNIKDLHNCASCGFHEEIPTSILFQTFIPDKLDSTVLEVSNSETNELPYTLKHLENFTKYLSEQIEESSQRTCKCGESYKIKKIIDSLPLYFILQVVWEGKIIDDLKGLEFFISLKYRINIKDIFPDSCSGMYNMIGFIANIPGHYVYIGKNQYNEWVLANDEEIKIIPSWKVLLNLCHSYKIKIVGIFYEKSDECWYEQIDIYFLKDLEIAIINKMKCDACFNFIEGEKCDNCGFSIDEFNQKWSCKYCEFFNISKSLVCGVCGNRRYEYNNPLCKGCKSPSTSLVCNNHAIMHCDKCDAIIQYFQQKYCGFCGRILSDFRNCLHCQIEYQGEGMICCYCSLKFWTCKQCESRVYDSNSCSKCGLKKNTKMWYCKPCKMMNLQNTPCKKCLKNQVQEKYCYVCGEIKSSENICACSYSFTCAKCIEIKNFPELKICWKDGGFIKDGICEKCKSFIPREWIVCQECTPNKNIIDDSTSEIFFNIQKYKKKTRKQCYKCGKKIETVYPFCWKCKEKIFSNDCRNCENNEKNICKDCLKVSYRCFSCKNTLFGSVCETCTFIQLPRLDSIYKLSYRSLEDYWTCLACNYNNNQIVLFCERCDHSKEYSFSQTYNCQYCDRKSHDKICKECFWLNYCSVCEKKIFITQKAYCGDCGNKINNQFCTNCDQYVSKHRIVCRGCSFKTDNCSCGERKYSKSLNCKTCRMKISYKKCKCMHCHRECYIDMCCFCFKECGEGNCEECWELNCEDTHYCRLCIYTGLKCYDCKQRRWGSCCKGLKRSVLI